MRVSKRTGAIIEKSEALKTMRKAKRGEAGPNDTLADDVAKVTFDENSLLPSQARLRVVEGKAEEDNK